jgi:peptide deformylase
MPGQGVGLAAPQIGVGLRLAVVDASLERGQVVRMANPEVIDASTEKNQHDEASPNLPGVSARITRPARVLVRYMDAHGMLVRKDFEGLWATSVQHQIDHLDGRMYFDRLSKVKRDMLLRKAAKLGGAG